MTSIAPHQQPIKGHDDHRIGRQHTGPGPTRKITKLALLATATVAATIALPAIANACQGEPTFQSPSGNIVCFMNVTAVQCYVVNHTYASHPGDCPSANPFGSFVLEQGTPPDGQCGDILSSIDPAPTLDYGQPRSVGTITCDSEPAGVTCTDVSTGHFFRIARESYQLG